MTPDGLLEVDAPGVTDARSGSLTGMFDHLGIAVAAPPLRAFSCQEFGPTRRVAGIELR